MCFSVCENAVPRTTRGTRNSDLGSVFSCFWWVLTKVHMCHQEWVRSHRSWITTKNNKLSVSVFLTTSLWGHERPAETRLHCVFGALFRWHTPSYVSGEVCTFMYPPGTVYQRIGPVVLQALWNHGENLSESFVMPLFVRSTVCSSVLVLKMRCSAVVGAHKSWSSWLCIRNPSSPPRCEAHCGWWRNLLRVSV